MHTRMGKGGNTRNSSKHFLNRQAKTHKDYAQTIWKLRFEAKTLWSQYIHQMTLITFFFFELALLFIDQFSWPNGNIKSQVQTLSKSWPFQASLCTCIISNFVVTIARTFFTSVHFCPSNYILFISHTGTSIIAIIFT